jgi:cytochrome c biogenesis protein CcmG, thiol:disulfide interchange protein DsbE
MFKKVPTSLVKIALLPILIVFGLLGVFLMYGNTGSNEIPASIQEYSPRVGYLAPNFALTDANNTSFQLSDYRGKPLLLNFWATWCPPCRAEMPEIEAAYRKFKNDGFTVLGIDAREDVLTVNKYVETGGYSWPMPIDVQGKVIEQYGVTAYPTSFFVDRSGFIRAVQIGGMDKKGLDERLKKIVPM